jgi:hypothetical protein
MQSPALAVSIATGPSQQVLRPSALESKELARELMKQAMFSDHLTLGQEATLSYWTIRLGCRKKVRPMPRSMAKDPL